MSTTNHAIAIDAQAGGQQKQNAPIEVLATLVNRAYERAKFWGGLALVLQAGLFVAGVIAIFWPVLTLSYPWIAVPLALIGAEITRRAGVYKSLAETAKRQHEYVSGFGIKPSKAQLADLRQGLKRILSPEDDELLKKGITYASEQQFGLRRVLENLCESAWYTKHLAGSCATWIGTTVCLAIVAAVSLLLWSASTFSSSSAGLAAAKSIAATFTFLISVGSIRSWIGYCKLAQKAKEVDSEAARLLAHDEPQTFDVQRLLTEYQIARAGGPLIPTWIWKIHRNSMNEDWKLRAEKQ